MILHDRTGRLEKAKGENATKEGLHDRTGRLEKRHKQHL